LSKKSQMKWWEGGQDFQFDNISTIKQNKI
jgi:hypothetical protein